MAAEERTVQTVRRYGFHGPSASTPRGGRLVVCRFGSDAVQTTNRTIENVFCQVVPANLATTPAALSD